MNIAVVGAGFVSNIRLENWRKVANAKVTAICDINADAASKLASKWFVPHVFNSLDQLLADRSEKI
jgi:predicted dehydrogenase